jgi:hypothetical protein
LNKTILKSHPYWHVRAIVEKRSEIALLSLSYYTYKPQTVSDTRLTWQITATEFCDASHIQQVLAETPEGQELAIHSDVTLSSGARHHLVMVDMSTSARAHLDKLRAFLGDHFFQQMAWFSSGRSFHGYGEDLFSELEWVKFMGLLLLSNRARLEPTVDPRWIGHRLLAGYSALRWTRNTSHYLVEPSRLEGKTSGPSMKVGALGTPIRR